MRSKTLLVSNILATAYSVYLLVYFWDLIVASIFYGFFEATEIIGKTFGYLFELFGESAFSYAESITIALTILVVLLLVHIVTFVLGTIFGFIGFGTKKSGLEKCGATLFLIGTLAFPLYFIISLPLTIIAFVGGSMQKKLNKAAAFAPCEEDTAVTSVKDERLEAVITEVNEASSEDEQIKNEKE